MSSTKLIPLYLLYMRMRKSETTKLVAFFGVSWLTSVEPKLVCCYCCVRKEKFKDT